MSEEKYWISIADSDVLLWIDGIVSALNLDLIVNEPDISPLAIQGPKSELLASKVFGSKISKLKLFDIDSFNFEGEKLLVAKSGYSKQGGYEIHVDNIKAGLELYDHLFEVGRKYNIKPGAPNHAERIEGGLLSYGNDMLISDNPFECGFEKHVHLNSDVEFLGKEQLKKIKSEGIKRKLMGVKIDTDKISVTGSMNLTDEKNNIFMSGPVSEIKNIKVEI